ncbi:ATP-binding protein [Streptomyces sp. NPDC003077]|uniref:ATP-binding protein n=1 Tax=Streptomyces sp. NPDC003077 TaxID=3154443 RepID=UPI0033A1510F
MHANMPAALASFARTACSVKEMRDFGAGQLARWGLPELVDTTKVLISELGTNAVQHGAGCSIGLAMSHARGQVRIAITDGSTEKPRTQTAGPYQEHGRGLFLVQTLAKEWGVSDNGTTTWCTLAAR